METLTPTTSSAGNGLTPGKSTESDTTPDLNAAVAHLQARFPAAPSALIWNCVNAAVTHLRGARIQLYLLILIERNAGEAVRKTVTTSRNDV